MERRNIISVSWGDHLVFGAGDGRLRTRDALQRRMEVWRDELGAAIIHYDNIIHPARNVSQDLQGIDGMPVKIAWGTESIVSKTETKTDLKGSLDPGRIDFAMFKGTYEVQVMGGTSEIANGITPDYGTGEACGDNPVANSLYHISFEVIFERTY